MTNLTIELNSVIEMTEEQFFQLCQKNPDLRFEKNAKGDLIIISPTGGETGSYNAALTSKIWIWNDQRKLGIVFDSSTGFKLPNGSNRSPDASWIPIEKWNNLTPEQRTKFLPLCPDFLIELMSPSDSLSKTREKMKEYLENGMQLGWLINPKNRQVEIYRVGKDVEILDSPEVLSGEDVLPGFILDMTRIW
ncbi:MULTISPECIES: Uma2 family endonuclease [Okeania]|uniref:Uma2 family endonuclease n=1 Tax=Okeania hirsuta TaxID=1458930 RepID=A0A3N6P561_9CYAN|nr:MULTISPECIES: Uma2 family endonuclease [Okeania]NET15555.1 Uma2 family endonuclease [Okeania sp. SIO1H6]NES74356.1 Uma2 family endonuclease [Okeania sp. SIO1H4]NES91701.1 Uma2 family endonuclease [Okeania sp. SIO2B9]NET18377.1 Uma2 family endonuclease [Okeania sp. SIO1H5]NET75990.1 Uma2 family endonuclease [Okeania sp. SIO1F9]